MSWQIVARFTTVAEAEAARSALVASGIETMLGDDELVAVNWLYSGAVGGVKLLVPDDDLERAAAVLFSRNDVALEAGDEVLDIAAPVIPPKRAIVCPTCGSSDAARMPRLRLFLFLAVVMIGVGSALRQVPVALAGVLASAAVAFVSPTHRCRQCGDKWTPPVEEDEPDDRAQAPLPDPADLIEVRCPRCGSADFYRIHYRRLKVVPMFVAMTALPLLLAWPFLPKRKCENCGLKR